MLLSTTVFETKNVSVFKITPGESHLLNFKKDNVVWKGSVRMIEEEDTEVDEDYRFKGFRLKLHFFNRVTVTSLLEDFSEIESENPWAEVWFSPYSEVELNYNVGNDKKATIRRSADPKIYGVTAQFPGSGFHPLSNSEKGTELQVALGMKLEDLFSAVSFSENLSRFERQFKAFHEKNLFDKQISALQLKFLNTLRSPIQTERENTPASDFDDDDFGNFVSSSYD